MSSNSERARHEEPRQPTQVGTVWEIVSQTRTSESGDTDHFVNVNQMASDFIPVGEHVLNLSLVREICLTFGTVTMPDYKATLIGFDGAKLVIHGDAVTKLQDALLKRVPRTP